MDFFQQSVGITSNLCQIGNELIYSILILFLLVLFIIAFAKWSEIFFSETNDDSFLRTFWMFLRYIGLCVMTYLAIQSIGDNVMLFTYSSIGIMLGIDILNTKKSENSENRIIAAINRLR